MAKQPAKLPKDMPLSEVFGKSKKSASTPFAKNAQKQKSWSSQGKMPCPPKVGGRK